METNFENLNSLIKNPPDLATMNVASAKEYIHALVTTLKLTLNEINILENEKAKWTGRVDLARSRSMEDLATEAEKEVERIRLKLEGLREEERSLKEHIEAIRKQLPLLAARERSIDPDLLEQELLMILGQSGEGAETERAFRKLEKENAADEALEKLKNKLKEDTP